MATDVALVFGDWHLPFHSTEATRLAMKVANVVQPRWAVQVGDLLDSYQLSVYDKKPELRNVTLKVEASWGRKIIRKLRARCEQVHILEGNHEERLRRILSRVPELHSTHPTMRELLELDESEWTPYQEYLTIGKCNFVHDLGPAGVNALRQTLEAAGSNVVFGHTHQGGVLYDGTLSGDRHVALNVGWLGNPDWATYATPRARARWQHGLGYVEIDRATGECWCHFLPFVNGKTNVPGIGIVSL